MKLFKKSHSGNVHIIIGFAVLIVLYYLITKYYPTYMPVFTTLDILVIGLVTIIYSQMPDVDTPMSRINQVITVASLIVAAYAVWLNEKTTALIIIGMLLFVRLTTHRTLIHSVFGAILFSAPLYFIKPLYAYIAFIMFLVHIISENEFSLFDKGDLKIFKR